MIYCFIAQWMDDKILKLAQNHQYYHQVQFQLYTLGASWCDFCVYTTKGIAIERIYLDELWQQIRIPNLN